MEDLDRITSALNTLRSVNQKRFSKYTAATRLSTGQEMKSLFGACASQSEAFNAEIERWLTPYAKQFKAFDDMPTLWDRMRGVVGANPSSGLSTGDFEELEVETLRTYKTILAYQFIPVNAQQDIERQALAIDKVRKTLHQINSKGKALADASR